MTINLNVHNCFKTSKFANFRFSNLNHKVSSGVNSKGSSLDSSHLDHRAPPPELNTIHRALFSDKKKSDDTEVATKPLFTVTMPKKGNLNNRQTYN